MDAPDREMQRFLTTQAGVRFRSEPVEPRLVDLCLVLWKRRRTFLIALIVGILAGLAVASLTPRYYESRAVIGIGRLGLDRPVLEPAEIVVERLRDQYNIGKSRQPPFLADVSVSRGSKDLVVAIAAGQTPDQAHDFLSHVVDRLAADHRELTQQGLLAARMRIELFSRQLAQFKEDLTNIEKRIRQALTYGVASEAMALTVEKNRLNEQVAEIEQLRIKAKAEVAEAEVRSTKSVHGPTAERKLAGWNPVIYVLGGLVAGFVLGLLAALVQELLVAVREQHALTTAPK